MNTLPAANLTWSIARNPFGALAITTADGTLHSDVQPVRSFPIQAPNEGISIVNRDGKEVVWIDQLGDVPEPARTLITDNLTAREFMPVLLRITSVSSFSPPCTWSVATDRGDTQFVLRGDEDIRRIGKEHALMISDIHGIQYFVPDQFLLDAQSKRILDRFM